MKIDYRLSHTTTFSYPIAVSVCHNIVCLTPRSGPRHRVRSSRLTITPKPTTTVRRTDVFGNTVHAFSIEEAHERLEIHASARVTVEADQAIDPGATGPWERVVAGVADQTDPGWLGACPFVYDSSMVRRSEAAREYARRVFTPNRPVLDAALRLTAQVFQDFEYRSGATHVGTTSEDALHLRRGVCQDFAHVQLAALRSIGLPARYVSGYLRTMPPPGKPRLIGADQSHAWVGVYCGPGVGWVGLDPTNNTRTSTDHIPLAVGRDYTDVAPIRGVYLGGGDSTFKVQVDVEPVAEDG